VVLGKKVMSNSSSKIGRWIAAGLAVAVLLAVFYNVAVDNMPKGEVRQVVGYTPWNKETLKAAEAIPIQNGGRIKPLATYAGFTMLGLHGARSMKISGSDGKTIKIKPTEWLLDTLFRPQLAVKQPTFRVDNSTILEAIGVKTRGKRDRYSYADIEPARDKLNELAATYKAIEKDKRDPVQQQTVTLAYNVGEYESLLWYFQFARSGVILVGSGKNGAADKHSNISDLMMTVPEIRRQVAVNEAKGIKMESIHESLLQQMFDAANFAKSGLFILPPADVKEDIWLSAGVAIMVPITHPKEDPKLAVEDVKSLEGIARSAFENEATFRTNLISLRDSLVKRAEVRGEYGHVKMEASFYRMDWFLNALVCFIFGTLTAFAMWTVGKGRVGRVLSWLTFTSTAVGLILCIIAMVQRSIIMQRPPVGNLYDTIIFIAATVVMISLLVEWMTRRRFALGVAPILGTLLIILSRRFELGDAKDYMDPLIAVLDSNYWLTTHVLTITLGYATGLLAAFLAFIYLLMRGLGLDNGDRDIRRSLTRAVYGMICLTLFLSLVGTVLGGIWANDSWGRFWGWDPKENGALLIVLWTLAILHGRLGGYIREWGLHFASVFTAAVVTFSWWHVNFLNTGLHNYGFTAGKTTIWIFYAVVVLILCFGLIVKMIEETKRKRAGLKTPTRPNSLTSHAL
jgi:ABC-type transport system involved in cytochrome c biogenesis permease subunit